MNIREPIVAGTFYPANPSELIKEITRYLKTASLITLPGAIKGIIAPHAGTIYSGPVAAYGYKMLKKAEITAPLKVILLGPSHQVSFSGAALSPADYWETPFGRVKVSSKVNELAGLGKGMIVASEEAHREEHCLEVQLPFLQITVENFEIIPLVLGELDYKILAGTLVEFIDDNTLVIASSDLSHYYPYALAVEIDALPNEAIPNLDFKKMEKAEACGKTAILTLMEIARLKNWQGKLLNYRNSGDTEGDKSKVVGYGSYAFFETK